MMLTNEVLYSGMGIHDVDAFFADWLRRVQELREVLGVSVYTC